MLGSRKGQWGKKGGTLEYLNCFDIMTKGVHAKLERCGLIRRFGCCRPTDVAICYGLPHDPGWRGLQEHR
jgi:hypothetical protein